MPRLALKLLCVALLAAAAGAGYALWLNPEMNFWKEAASRKLAWVEQMRAKHGHVIGVVGGSTTTFGIDAEMLDRDYNLPVANLGLHAGMGARACTGFGFSALQPGDTLILSLEPSLLCEDSGQTSLATKLAFLLGRPEILGWNEKHPALRFVAGLPLLQPGGYHVVSMLGKLALGKPPYRYSIENLRPGGLQVTPEHREFGNSLDGESNGEDGRLSGSGRRLLEDIAETARQREIRVVYVLPWAFWPEPTASRLRSENGRLLAEISAIVPVLCEPGNGVSTVRDDFSDSRQHLTAEAARRRSAVFASTLAGLDGSRAP